MRLSAISCIEFKGDEARDALTAVNFVHHGVLPLAEAMSSVGTFNPPLFIYLLGIPFCLSDHPVVASGFVAVMNLLAICLCFLFCNKFFTARVAIIATLLFATNPWAVLYSRKLWANNVLPLFVLGFYYSLFEMIINGKGKYLVVAFLSLAALTQLHPTTACYGLLLVGVLLIYRPKISVWHLCCGVGAAVTLYVPYLIHEFTHDFYDLRAFAGLSGLPSTIRPEALLRPFSLATTNGFIHYFDLPALDRVQALMLLAGVGVALYNAGQRKYLLLALGFFTPMLFMLRSQVSLPNHYFLSLLPASFILLGVFADAAGRWLGSRQRFLEYAFNGLVVLLVGYQTVTVIGFNHYLQTHHNIRWMDYGPPLRFRAQEIEGLLRKSDPSVEGIQKQLTENRNEDQTFKYDVGATKYIAEYIDFPGGNPLLQARKGNDNYAKGDFSKAISCYTRAVSISPDFAEGYNNRGAAFFRRGDQKSAISDFDAAIRINPTNAGYYFNRAAVYLATKNYEKAWEDVGKVQDLGGRIAPGFIDELKRASERK